MAEAAGAAAQQLEQLALLDQQATRLREELQGLYLQLAEARSELGASRSGQLQEANEQLVLAALHAQAQADQATTRLDELARSGQRDALTALPNRALGLDRLDRVLAIARRDRRRVAVFFLDLDGFKQINDRGGHAAGDAVLGLAARRLESAVRESDTVSRYGGDEFLVVLADVKQVSDVALIARKMLAAIALPAVVDGQPLQLSASLGIALYPRDGDDGATLIRHADAAMYRSKRQREGGFEFHAAARHAGAASAAIADSAPSRAASLLADLVEANERLVLTALAAEQAEAQGRELRKDQVKFLAMVAHELRNPLAPLSTAADLLHRARTDEPLLSRLQLIIKRQVAHLTRLVEDLLDGARLGTGRIRLERQMLDLGDVLDLSVDSCRPAMLMRQQQLETDWPSHPLPIYGDPVRLTQVFSNLLDNASKYTPLDGRITLAAVTLGRMLVVTVSDNGIGISADALPHVFELFVQDSQALALHKHGLGIGLAVVRELAEAHGGSVIGHSGGPGLGSEFIVTLPMTLDPGAVSG